MTQTNEDRIICDNLVTSIAKLARLRLTGEESAKYKEDFSSLLALFHELNDIPHYPHKSLDINLMAAEECREDVPEENTTLSSLPTASDHFNPESSFFDVPQFIGNDE
tara:strand:- start:5476 stop:5799 length:324 start_codon:yes stop_codon:yes gene_type:complete